MKIILKTHAVINGHVCSHVSLRVWLSCITREGEGCTGGTPLLKTRGARFGVLHFDFIYGGGGFR